MENRESQIMILTKELEQECNLCTQDVFKLAKTENPKLEYQDVTNIYLLRKIAELQLEISDLKTKIHQQ